MMHQDITTILESCEKTIQYLSYVYQLDADDLCQDLAVELLEHPRHLDNPIAYYRVVVRTMALQRAMRPTIRSLDMPMMRDDDNSMTLGETLAAPPQGSTPDHSRTDNRAQLLYRALRKIPLEEQMYVREVYELNAYNPVPVPGQRPNYDRSRNAICHQVYTRLRKDQELTSAVSV